MVHIYLYFTLFIKFKMYDLFYDVHDIDNIS